MFDVYCPREGARVLLSTRNILVLSNRPSGIEVRYRCVCGYEGVCRPGSEERQERVAG